MRWILKIKSVKVFESIAEDVNERSYSMWQSRQDYKHEDVRNRTQTTTGQNLEIEGKVAKIIAGN